MNTGMNNAINLFIRKLSEKLMGFIQVGAVAALVFATSAQAQTVFTKANNTTALNATGSWTNNAVPGSSDIARWDSTVTAGNTVNLGANLSWGGIQIANPGGAVTITNASYTLTLNSSGTAIDMSEASQNLTINSLVALATNQTWNVGASRTLTAGGVISGGFGLTKAGSGTLTLQSANTYSGDTVINAGIVNVNGVSGALVNTSGIAVNRASLVIGDTANALANRINDAATVTLGGGTLTLQGKNSAATTETIGTLTIGAGGQSTVTVTPGTSGTAALTLTSITHSGTGGTATFESAGTIATSQALANGILGGWALWGYTPGQRGNAVTVSGGNLNYLSTFDKTYTGTTNNINDWTSAQNIYFTNGTFTATLGADLSANSLTFLDDSNKAIKTLDLGGKTLSLTSGGIFFPYQTLSGGYLIQNGTLKAGAGTAPAELFITSANYDYTAHSTISATIADNNGYAVSVVQHPNPGTPYVNNVLSGNNSYSGGTYINTGYIYINNDNNLGAVNGAVYFQGGSLGIWGNITLNASRNLVAAANAAAIIDTYMFGGGGTKICTIAGKVTGAGNFAKAGTNPTRKLDTGAIAGTVILTNPGNDWAGTTTISAGILQIGDGTSTAGSLPDRAVSLSGANTTLKFANPTAINFNSIISGYGDLIKAGAGTLTLGGVNTYSNGTTISGGTLAIASDAALGAAYDGSVSGATVTNANNTLSGVSLTFSAPPSGTTAAGTINLNNVWSSNNNLWYMSALSGGSGYVAPPTVTVNGANNGAGLQAYVKGLLTLDGGTLQTTAGITSSRAVYLTSNSGTIDTAGNNSTFSGVFNGPGGLTMVGAGTLTLSATNTYTGGTTVSNGTLIVNGSVTGAVTVVSGCTLGGTGVVAGVVTNNGTIMTASGALTGALTVTNLVMANNSTYNWKTDVTTNDVIVVNGNLILPTSQIVTVNVNQTTGRLPNPGVLITGFTNSPSTDLSKWVINGALPSCKAQVVGNQVLLVSPKGWVMSVE
jgi:autotransporter-associated beta strand protein